ncbi:MAG: helix-turn-helix transcriptional regulator [Oscillospiraceae bacterium]|nr:helix-turn-helix transcriptional regulator [Oscillospiraceae bacterium]
MAVLGLVAGFALPVFIAVIVCIVLLILHKNKKQQYAPPPPPPAYPPAPPAPPSRGEIIKNHRVSRNMTQEFIAESLGVSRQAVSKWEMNESVPSTANLMALAKLFNIPPEKLL